MDKASLPWLKPCSDKHRCLSHDFGSSALSPAPMNKDLLRLLRNLIRKVPSEEPESADNIVDFPRPYAVSELASTECDSVSKQIFMPKPEF